MVGVICMATLDHVASVNVLNTLNKNEGALQKSLKKVSSGLKIKDAYDGSSEYAISERMKVMVRALKQDAQNAQNGASMLKIAEGGIQGIVDSLRDMKAMAIDSANDHNSETDRAIIQKVFAQHIEEIDDIAATTNYNGINLLDGRWREPGGYTINSM